MPDVDVAATPAAISSEPSSLGGGGGAIELSDEDILGISSEDTPPAASPAAESPAASEQAAPAPDKTETQETPPAPEPVDDLKWMRPLLNDKVFGPKLQSMHDKLLAYQELHPTVADLRAVKELIPGGVEELKNLIALKQEAEEMDLQFLGGDLDQQRGYLQSLKHESPEAFQSAVQIGLELLKADSPQEWAYLTNHTTGESLQADKVWDWLEYIHETATKSGDEPVAQLLDQFAGLFQKYGLGPNREQDPNLSLVNQQRSEVERKYQQLQQERERDFHSSVEQSIDSTLGGEVDGQLAKLLPKTSDGLRHRIAKDIHTAIQESLRANAGLALQIRNLKRTGGINRQTQEQVANLLISKARQLMPGSVKKIVDAYTADVMSRRNATTDKQNQAASRVDVSSGARPGTGVRPITAEEAQKMSDMDILESDRPFVKRR